jgi:3-oxoacyl-[acyl-carrier protein] reductase
MKVASEISKSGYKAIGIEADVSNSSTVEAAFELVELEFGQIHAVINCAGIQGQLGKRSHEVPVEDLDAVYQVNLRGALVVSQAAIRKMLPYGYGRLVQVASIAGKEGNPGMISYSTTKAGLIGMVKAQGKEYARDGITINALAPAVIQTPFLDTQPSEVIAYMTEKIPMGRAGTVDEVAELLGFMVSPACSFTTGFTFDLSGGRATY